MNLKLFAPSNEKIIVPADYKISDDVIYLNTNLVSVLSPREKGRPNTKPWKNRIVKINAPGSKFCVYKTIFGKNFNNADEKNALMSFRSLHQLGLEDGSTIEIKKGFQIFYRHMFYYNHLNDAVRVSYKVGVYGLLFGILGIAATIILS